MTTSHPTFEVSFQRKAKLIKEVYEEEDSGIFGFFTGSSKNTGRRKTIENKQGGVGLLMTQRMDFEELSKNSLINK